MNDERGTMKKRKWYAINTNETAGAIAAELRRLADEIEKKGIRNAPPPVLKVEYGTMKDMPSFEADSVVQRKPTGERGISGSWVLKGKI